MTYIMQEIIYVSIKRKNNNTGKEKKTESLCLIPLIEVIKNNLFSQNKRTSNNDSY